jgi:hypothetical protein
MGKFVSLKTVEESSRISYKICMFFLKIFEKMHVKTFGSLNSEKNQSKHNISLIKTRRLIPFFFNLSFHPYREAPLF